MVDGCNGNIIYDFQLGFPYMFPICGFRKVEQGPNIAEWTRVIEDTLGLSVHETTNQKSFGQALLRATFCKGLPK